MLSTLFGSPIIHQRLHVSSFWTIQEIGTRSFPKQKEKNQVTDQQWGAVINNSWVFKHEGLDLVQIIILSVKDILKILWGSKFRPSETIWEKLNETSLDVGHSSPARLGPKTDIKGKLKHVGCNEWIKQKKLELIENIDLKNWKIDLKTYNREIYVFICMASGRSGAFLFYDNE